MACPLWLAPLWLAPCGVLKGCCPFIYTHFLRLKECAINTFIFCRHIEYKFLFFLFFFIFLRHNWFETSSTTHSFSSAMMMMSRSTFSRFSRFMRFCTQTFCPLLSRFMSTSHYNIPKD